MIVVPKIRGFICTTAHPTGCKENVRRQIEYVQSHGAFNGPKKVLVIGASTGYGLASRISAAFGSGAATIGVSFERPATGKRTASAGYYNNIAFDTFAANDNLYAKTILGDAFSGEIKSETIEAIRADLGQVDLVVYSLASPRRTLPDGTTVSSVLKTTGSEYTNKTINLSTETVSEITIPPATQEEIEQTVQVMGGEDWADWMKALTDAGVVSEHAVTLAYSYIGPELTHPIYKDGSIGQAKKHLQATADQLTKQYRDLGLKAYISVNKALVTQASAAIPIVPLYISILYKIMKEQGLHEGCIEQMDRMFREKLYVNDPVLDEENRIRMDDWEMRDDVQAEITRIWSMIADSNLNEYADIAGYWNDFREMFGFDLPGVDYDADVEIEL